METSFSAICHGLILDDSENMYPCSLYGHSGEESNIGEKSSTTYGIVTEGEATLETSQGRTFTLHPGMYFCAPGPVKFRGKSQVALFERKGYRGLFQIGGPVENQGRLVYIDNCRSTILVGPARLGDPCLNLLTFPPGVEQTMHIHPTIRIGTVLAGNGKCLYGRGREANLQPGMVFYLAEAVPHCFHSGPEPLTVIAFHPDSDVGPTDQSHPMLSRTYTNISGS